MKTKGDLVRVKFFDSFSLKNRIEYGRFISRRPSPTEGEMVTVELDQPIRKRVTVPGWCVEDMGGNPTPQEAL